ncbi:MAG TPA: thioredoxin [Methanomicrobiales archaeon]|nr:thioredoxin [Methanomicrobiales archaeon]
MDDELEELRKKRLEEMERSFQKKEGGGGVITITESEFQSMLSTHPRLVIDFWAEWCGPCRMVGPIIEQLADEFSGNVTFGKCNTDENPRIATKFGISAIPTIMLFANGQLVDRIIGAYPRDTIRARIVRAFQLQV